MTRKEPVMRKNDFDELEKRVNEQKRLIQSPIPKYLK